MVLKAARLAWKFRVSAERARSALLDGGHELNYVIFQWHLKISREYKKNHAHAGFWDRWFPVVSLGSRWVVDVDWWEAGKCNTIIGSNSHQQKANISTGRCTSLQCLTCYHNIVAESPLAPLFQLIAEHRAADPKLHSFYGELSSTLFWRSTSLCIQTPTGRPLQSCWEAYQRKLKREAYCSLLSCWPSTAPLKSSLKLCLRVFSHHQRAQPQQSAAY